MNKSTRYSLFWWAIAVLCMAILLLVFVKASEAQTTTVSPFMGLGNVQVFDNNGNACTACVLYSYQAGTSMQQATYTDGSGSFQNPNPITFGAGARSAIWLSSGALYKFVLCVQNDGAACSPGDVLFTVDQIPGGSTSSGGGGGTGIFTGTFISGSANPASSGNFRAASGDSFCFRNAANSANLCVSKDTSDVLSWAGGAFKLPEGVCSNLGVGFDYFCADSTAHRLKISGNGGAYAQAVASGVDINTSDQVIQLHFGTTAAPVCSTAPTTGQALQWTGSCIGGSSLTTQEVSFGWGGFNAILGGVSSTPCSTGVSKICAITTLNNSHTLIRFIWQGIQAASGCSPNAVIGVVDLTSSSTLYSVTVTTQLGYVDSGVLSVAMPAGHAFGVGLISSPSGCSIPPTSAGLTMVYQ